MNKIIIGTVFLVTAILLPADADWLSNGGFDDWTAGSPDSWSASTADTTAYRPAFFGLYTLELEATATSGSVSQSGSSSTGTAVLQLWWRNGGAGTGKVVVSGSVSGTVYDSGNITLSTAWEPVNVSFAVVAETLTVTIMINGLGNRLHVDDVWLGLNPNLISNPGFESWTAGSPDDWTVRAGTSVAQSTDSVDGTYSVKVGYISGQGSLIAQTVSVSPNTTYYIGYDRKVDLSTSKNTEFVIGTPSGTEYWDSFTRYGDMIWSRLGNWFTTNPTDTSVTIQFYVGVNSGDFGHIDRVYLGKRPPLVGPGGGGTYKEDRQLYPVGWFSLISNEPSSRIQQHIDEGANAVQPTPADPCDYINVCGSLGINVMPWGDPLDSSFNQWTATQPQVMAYRYIDEPSTGGSTSTSEYQTGYDAFKVDDPSRLLACSSSFADISAYPYDLFMKQWYPVKAGLNEFDGFADSVNYFREWTRYAIEWGKDGSFVLPQSFWMSPTNGPPYNWQQPTVAECAYLGIAPMVHGFNGSLWWNRSSRTTDTHCVTRTAPVLQEMGKVAPAMLNPALDNLVTCSDSGTHISNSIGSETVWDINWTLRKVPDANDYVLVATNDTNADKAAVQFSVTLPSSEYPAGTYANVISGSLVYLGSDEEVGYAQLGSPAVLTWQDDLDSYAAKVYWISDKTPECGDTLHPHPDGDVTGDCKVDSDDLFNLSIFWLDCTHPDCD